MRDWLFAGEAISKVYAGEGFTRTPTLLLELDQPIQPSNTSYLIKITGVTWNGDPPPANDDSLLVDSLLVAIIATVQTFGFTANLMSEYRLRGKADLIIITNPLFKMAEGRQLSCTFGDSLFEQTKGEAFKPFVVLA